MIELDELPEVQAPDDSARAISDSPDPTTDLPGESAPPTFSAPQDLEGEQDGQAAIFANPKDLYRYQMAILNGASHEEANRVGDSGMGRFGDNTATYTTPMVELPSDTPGLKPGRLVKVSGPDGSVVAKIADVMPRSDQNDSAANIGLNPAAALAVGHRGGIVPVKWEYASDENGSQQQPSLDLPKTMASKQNLGYIGNSFDPTVGEEDSIKARNKDGSVTFTNGLTVYKDGTMYRDIGGERYIRHPSGIVEKLGKVTPPKEQTLDTSTLKELNSRGIKPDETMTKVSAWQAISDYDKKQQSQVGHIYDSLTPTDQKIADAIADYRYPVGTGSRMLASKDPYGRKIIAAAMEKNPTFDVNTYQERATYMKQWGSTQQGTVGGQRDSLNRLIQHLSSLNDSAQALPGHDITAANSIENFFNTKTGKPYQAEFEAKKNLVINELDRLVKQGVPTNFDVQTWEKSLNSSQSKEQLDAVIKKAIPELVTSPLNVIKDGFENRMNKPLADKDVLYPHTQPALRKLGISLGNDEAPAPTSTATPKPSNDPMSAVNEAQRRFQANPGDQKAKAVLDRAKELGLLQ